MAFFHYMGKCFQDFSVGSVSSVSGEGGSGEGSSTVFFRDVTEGCW